ncbi:MAG: hypothetical protein ACODAJ_06995 [Planctomycetota bacterium]
MTERGAAGIAQFWATVQPVFGGDLLFQNGLIPGFLLNLAVAYTLSLITGGAQEEGAVR